MRTSCTRSRLAKNTSIMSLWSGRSGYSLGSTNWNGEEGCDDEHLAVTRDAGAQLQLRDHALQCPSSWRTIASYGPALGGPERIRKPARRTGSRAHPGRADQEHLVEELAGIIWRKRRLQMAEAAVYREKLHHDATGHQAPERLAAAALLPL